MLVQPVEDYIETRGTNVPIKALGKEKKYEVIIESKSVFGRTSFYIIDDMFPNFPMEWPGKLFRTVDQRRDGWATSRHVPGFSGTVSCKVELLRILKKDRGYFEHLVDGESEAVAKFKEIFPNQIC